MLYEYWDECFATFRLFNGKIDLKDLEEELRKCKCSRLGEQEVRVCCAKPTIQTSIRDMEFIYARMAQAFTWPKWISLGLTVTKVSCSGYKFGYMAQAICFRYQREHCCNGRCLWICRISLGTTWEIWCCYHFKRVKPQECRHEVDQANGRCAPKPIPWEAEARLSGSRCVPWILIELDCDWAFLFAVPFFARALWGIVKQFIDRDTVSKIRLGGSASLVRASVVFLCMSSWCVCCSISRI